MRVELHFDESCWCRVLGQEDAIQAFEGQLLEWSASFDDGARLPVFVRHASGLLVLKGAALDVMPHQSRAPAMVSREQEPGLDRKLAELGSFLRPYQAEAVRAVFTAPGGQGIISIPMGGGKTRICATIAAVGRMFDLEDWLYVVANRELARQSEKEVATVMPELCDKLELDDEPAFTACTYTTAPAPARGTWSGVLVDECHLLAARTRSEAYVQLMVEGPRVGLSGTPLDRTDKRNALTLALLGPVIYETDVARLEKEGYLAQSKVRTLIYDRDTGTLSKG